MKTWCSLTSGRSRFTHSSFGRPSSPRTGLPCSSRAVRRSRKSTYMMGVPFSPLRTCPPASSDLAVTAPAWVGVAAVERVQREVQGVAAAVVPAALEVVRKDALARLPGLPARPGRKVLQNKHLTLSLGTRSPRCIPRSESASSELQSASADELGPSPHSPASVAEDPHTPPSWPSASLRAAVRRRHTDLFVEPVPRARRDGRPSTPEILPRTLRSAAFCSTRPFCRRSPGRDPRRSRERCRR